MVTWDSNAAMRPQASRQATQGVAIDLMRFVQHLKRRLSIGDKVWACAMSRLDPQTHLVSAGQDSDRFLVRGY